MQEVNLSALILVASKEEQVAREKFGVETLVSFLSNCNGAIHRLILL